MRKPDHLPRNLLLAGLMVLLLRLCSLLGISCIPRRLTGIICPGCGLTRACLAALRFDLAAAFRYHPMFWAVPVFLLFFLFDGRIFKNVRLNNGILYGLVAAFIICYLLRLIAFLGGTLAI